jgi:hypothetical protein
VVCASDRILIVGEGRAESDPLRPFGPINLPSAHVGPSGLHFIAVRDAYRSDVQPQPSSGAVRFTSMRPPSALVTAKPCSGSTEGGA